MECKRCKKENQQVKAGKTKAGSQRYKCKHCGKVYTPGRILGIGKNMCLYWIKKYAKEIELENAANEREKVIEMDKLYSYVKRKKQILRDNISK